ncbi:MAG: FecR family protein [Chitinophagaceae bacterium]|nr:FecR family protein [Chitinophagaceae bacterium]
MNTERDFYIGKLISAHMLGGLSSQEQMELDAWLDADEKNRLLFAELSDPEQLAADLKLLEGLKSDISRQNILASLKQGRATEVPVAHRIHFLKTTWFRYAAAIIIIAGIGTYLWNTQQKAKPLITSTKPVPVKNDVLPGGQKAILTLSDGKKIELNNTASETIHDQALSIENNNGQLIYKKGELVAMNTMTTPKGGQYQLTLADGTRVWLNAASSITYPTAFTGNKREVSITGEAYFEVAKNAQQPFHVKTPKEEITVLGTEFNVHAYNEEPSKTSLIEGSVKINDRILQPGQAFINGNIISTNIEQDIAWKNGYFSFENKSLEQIMTELARWYDVQVTYEQGVPKMEFMGMVGRNLTLSQVLSGLQKVGLKLRLEENRRLVILR